MNLKKFLILIGRTFIATFLLVNIFNIIPFNFSRNAWYVEVSTLLVDTASLMLLGLVCLKLVSLLSIQDNKLISSSKELKANVEHLDIDQEQKYHKNLININKFSKYLVYFFIFIAALQFFVVINGYKQIDLISSQNIIRVENNFNKFKKNNSSKSINKEIDNQTLIDKKLSEKNKINKDITKFSNRGKFLLIKNFLRVFLMSLVWAYGFFKLAQFS